MSAFFVQHKTLHNLEITQTHDATVNSKTSVATVVDSTCDMTSLAVGRREACDPTSNRVMGGSPGASGWPVGNQPWAQPIMSSQKVVNQSSSTITTMLPSALSELTNVDESRTAHKLAVCAPNIKKTCCFATIKVAVAKTAKTSSDHLCWDVLTSGTAHQPNHERSSLYKSFGLGRQPYLH